MRHRLLILSAALWCAFGIAAGTMRSAEETAPAPLLESPEPVLVEILAKADRLPLAPALAITDRWLDAPAERSDELVLVTPQIDPRKLTSPAKPRRRDVCARHGMHKQITRGGRSWRCRR
jgi:hypothetical protein